MRCCLDNHSSLVIFFLIRKMLLRHKMSWSWHNLALHYLPATKRDKPPSFNCHLILRLNWFSFSLFRSHLKNRPHCASGHPNSYQSVLKQILGSLLSRPALHQLLPHATFQKTSPILFVMQWPLVFSSVPFSSSTSTDGPLNGISDIYCLSQKDQFQNSSWESPLSWTVPPLDYASLTAWSS